EKRTIPEAPIGLDESTPPDGFTGNRPPSAVSPDSVSFHPSPSAANPRFSNHIGSNQEKGTWISAVSTSESGSSIPASDHNAAAASLPACGLTWSRPENTRGSVRIAVERTHAAPPGTPSPARSSPMIIAQAPSEEGQVSS